MFSPREKGEIVKKAAERISVGSNEEKNSRKCLNRACQFRHFLHKVAETVGFEPTDPCGSTDFESFSQRVNFRSFRVSFRSSRLSENTHKIRLF